MIWSKEKILAYANVSDEVEIMLENGFIWRGRLIGLDEDVIRIHSSSEKSDKIVNVCIPEISVLNVLVSKYPSDVDKALSKKNGDKKNNRD